MRTSSTTPGLREPRREYLRLLHSSLRGDTHSSLLTLVAAGIWRSVCLQSCPRPRLVRMPLPGCLQQRYPPPTVQRQGRPSENTLATRRTPMIKGTRELSMAGSHARTRWGRRRPRSRQTGSWGQQGPQSGPVASPPPGPRKQRPTINPRQRDAERGGSRPQKRKELTISSCRDQVSSGYWRGLQRRKS